ncbi:uncharacterized protein BJ171DRAFT_511243 [Polychytrium aggregatum]|uniref:uncharacterized protein n=1 Tax=Polychytrium aggregatum TaxID=110093 RepID=UPI0022FE30A0|nr:uncharacterized protein BJ171DRAFT_511243 [Polychytrium aggregatum]KAI9203236.1 hypothetical protein BJ171DRAFT_511243 [Polychytrium aggregatum]
MLNDIVDSVYRVAASPIVNLASKLCQPNSAMGCAEEGGHSFPSLPTPPLKNGVRPMNEDMAATPSPIRSSFSTLSEPSTPSMRAKSRVTFARDDVVEEFRDNDPVSTPYRLGLAPMNPSRRLSPNGEHILSSIKNGTGTIMVDELMASTVLLDKVAVRVPRTPDVRVHQSSNDSSDTEEGEGEDEGDDAVEVGVEDDTRVEKQGDNGVIDQVADPDECAASQLQVSPSVRSSSAQFLLDLGFSFPTASGKGSGSSPTLSLLTRSSESFRMHPTPSPVKTATRFHLPEGAGLAPFHAQKRGFPSSSITYQERQEQLIDLHNKYEALQQFRLSMAADSIAASVATEQSSSEPDLCSPSHKVRRMTMIPVPDLENRSLPLHNVGSPSGEPRLDGALATSMESAETQPPPTATSRVSFTIPDLDSSAGTAIGVMASRPLSPPSSSSSFKTATPQFHTRHSPDTGLSAPVAADSMSVSRRAILTPSAKPHRKSKRISPSSIQRAIDAFSETHNRQGDSTVSLQQVEKLVPPPVASRRSMLPKPKRELDEPQPPSLKRAFTDSLASESAAKCHVQTSALYSSGGLDGGMARSTRLKYQEDLNTPIVRKHLRNRVVEVNGGGTSTIPKLKRARTR